MKIFFLIVKSCSRHIVFCRHFYHFSKVEYNPWNRAVDCFEHWRNLTPCWEFLSKWISKSFHNFLSNITICILIRCSFEIDSKRFIKTSTTKKKFYCYSHKRTETMTHSLNKVLKFSHISRGQNHLSRSEELILTSTVKWKPPLLSLSYKDLFLPVSVITLLIS